MSFRSLAHDALPVHQLPILCGWIPTAVLATDADNVPDAVEVLNPPPPLVDGPVSHSATLPEEPGTPHNMFDLPEDPELSAWIDKTYGTDNPDLKRVRFACLKSDEVKKAYAEGCDQALAEHGFWWKLGSVAEYIIKTI